MQVFLAADSVTQQSSIKNRNMKLCAKKAKPNVNYVSRAIDADECGHFKSALHWYTLAIEDLLSQLKNCTNDEKKKNQLGKWLEDYISRAEYIKTHLLPV